MRTSIDNELLALEKQYWDAIRNKDAATAARLSDERCVVIGQPHTPRPSQGTRTAGAGQ
jgi:hypothetical protein